MFRGQTDLFLPLLLLVFVEASSPMSLTREEAVHNAQKAITRSKDWAKASMWHAIPAQDDGKASHGSAWADCVQLYEASELRIGWLRGEYDMHDARAWLSAAMTNHATCMAGLRERNQSAPHVEQRELELLLGKALAIHALPRHHRHRRRHEKNRMSQTNSTSINAGLLVSWDESTDEADIVVAQDGSGDFKTIKEAVTAAANYSNRRVTIHIKSGTYDEQIGVDHDTRNLFMVGDGIDKTIITGHRNVPDGSTTYSSATFGVSGDGFWARDITFENTAGPAKHQAVALRVNSDRSVFYRCSIKGYQDTLFVHSLRQFYRECDVYGTIDFIFGNAAAVLQNCNIIVRRPMAPQSNVVTAQGRDNPNDETGISVHGSRVVAASEFEGVKGSFRSYLGRPWKRYSRTVYMQTDMDGLVHPEGWAEWSGDYGLDTLYYGEYMNRGDGSDTSRRVKWPGFHVMTDPSEAEKFTVERFIQGVLWLPETGVPYWPGLPSSS